MRSVLLPARYQGRHVKPALHPTRSTLSAGLTAALLPLCLASPAVADTVGGSTPVASSSTATMPLPPVASPAPEGEADESSEPQRLDTELRISGPSGAVSPGAHLIGVRLLADDQPVKDAYVRLERRTADGWEYVGRLLTKEDGLGKAEFRFDRTTRLRATYDETSTRAAATSRELVVSVASFRARAVQVAAQQKGKPYRYGSTGPNSFDCSGLVQFAFKQVGKSLPRTSREQLRATQRISKTQMRPGDLVFTQRNGRIGHVGVYAGDNKWWVAPKRGDVVKLQTIYTSNYVVGRVG